MKKYEIEKLGAFGEGVARDGKVVFIKGALPGEIVLAEEELEKKSFIRARLKKVLKSSPDRVKPPCPYFYVCGGCALQHLAYDAQLALKAQSARETIKKTAGIDVVIDEIIPSSPYRYRNKLSFPVTGKKVGLYSENSHDAVDIYDCLIQREWNKPLTSALRLFMSDYGPSFKDKRGIRHIVAREKEGSVSVTLVTTSHTDVSRFFDYIPFENFALYQNVNDRDDNVILGKEFFFIGGKGKFPPFHPASFYQVNDEIEKRLYDDVCSFVKGDIVVDAYCGAGNLTLRLAASAKAAIGVEIVPQAVEEAEKRARAHNVDNVAFICGDCSVVLPMLQKSRDVFADDRIGANERVSTVILDPPRKGVDESTLNAVSDIGPDRIIYVSCNPATLARDLMRLAEHYEVLKVNIYDMFPQTPHVETLVVLQRK